MNAPTKHDQLLSAIIEAGEVGISTDELSTLTDMTANNIRHVMCQVKDTAATLGAVVLSRRFDDGIYRYCLFDSAHGNLGDKSMKTEEAALAAEVLSRTRSVIRDARVVLDHLDGRTVNARTWQRILDYLHTPEAALSDLVDLLRAEAA